jgi:hypothetical protein
VGGEESEGEGGWVIRILLNVAGERVLAREGGGGRR